MPSNESGGSVGVGVVAKVVHGACLCGNVKLTVTGKELTSYICHCDNCKTFFGTPFSAAAWYPSNNVTIKTAAPLGSFGDKKTTSGAVLTRKFCSNCGSPICGEHSFAPGVTIVIPGVLETKQEWQPQYELFTKNKSAWLGEWQCKDLTSIDANFDNMDFLKPSA